MKATDKLIIGYLGNGKSTNRYHIPFLIRRSDRIQVKTIYDVNLNASQWEAIPGVKYTDNIDEILGDPEIQVVICPVPAAAHFEIAKKVLGAGKNCVMEKPFTQTYEEAVELFKIAEEKGVMIQCYQNRRFDSDFLTVQKIIESGSIGDLLELEMHYDYFRPEVPINVKSYSKAESYLYNHACHTIDQVISYFGKPDNIHYDVKQILGPNRMNDYFDIDLFYGTLKVSVKSSYFRIKSRPSFVVYGKKGMFVKESKDRQEDDLKKFYLPNNEDFGIDLPEHYGTLTYVDDKGEYHEEKVASVIGDYGRYYDALYNTILHGETMLVSKEQTLLQMKILEDGLKGIY